MMRQMRRVYLLYTQEGRDELIATLQKLGVLHLEETRLEDEASPRSAEELAQDRQWVENLLIKARGTLELFAEVDPGFLRLQAKEAPPARLEVLSQALREELEALEGRLRRLVAERREVKDHLAAVERFGEIVEKSEELLRTLRVEGRELIATIGEAKDEAFISEIERALEAQIPGRFQLASTELSEDRVELLVSVDSEYAPAVREYLEAKGLRPLALPAHIEGDFAKGIAQLRADEKTLPRRLEELEEELRSLAEEHAARMVTLTTALENRLLQLEAASRFGYTNYALVISGWVPQDELGRFREELTRKFPELIIQDDPIRYNYEEIPVAFHHRPWAKPYYLFLKAFGTPKPGSVDPVPYISIFFPIFFAVIVGDIGYGLVILALALWGLGGFAGVKLPLLKKLSRSETGRSALKVMLHGGAFSIVLGFVFGEFFGLEFEQLGIHGIGPWPFSRLHRAIDLLLFTVALGAVQVVMGFLFGMVTALRHGDRRHLAAKIGLLLSLVAFALIMGRLMGIVPERLLLPGVGTLAVAIPLLWYGGGAIVLMESLSPFIHVLSYARIMGFGVASVVLAVLINGLVGGLGALGNLVLGVILGAIVAVVFHTINLVLHVFEGTIQSARLHWVEFFEKFLLEEMGGVPYRPFKEVKPSIPGEE